MTRATTPAADVLTRAEVAAVAARIQPYLRCTPVVSLDRADFGLPAGLLTLKLEQLQHSGSFKARGAFNQAETVLGAGTLGLELLRQAPDITTVLAGIGGGGLLSGIATACDGGIRVVGVEPEGAPTMTEALAAGRPVDAATGSVAVDSLAPRRVGELTFSVVSARAHSVVLVSDEAILQAQQALWDKLRVVGEPGGCAALAALLSGRYVPEPDERVAVVVSGANTTAVSFGG